jgi:uncharacterized membrane protein YphA (DoxX/SURF4 family)
MLEQRLNTPWWALRLTFGLVPIIAGLDKFTNLLARWENYLSPWITQMLPVSPRTFMMLVGVIEIAAGILVLSKLTRVGAYVVCAWLVCIAMNLVTAGYLDVAVRDLSMAMGAFALARLSEVRESATRPATARRHHFREAHAGV